MGSKLLIFTHQRTAQLDLISFSTLQPAMMSSVLPEMAAFFERETDKKGEMRKKKKQKSFGKKQDLGQHAGERDDICENPQNRSNLERMAGV